MYYIIIRDDCMLLKCIKKELLNDGDAVRGIARSGLII
jgi:hypothetical protein